MPEMIDNKISIGVVSIGPLRMLMMHLNFLKYFKSNIGNLNIVFLSNYSEDVDEHIIKKMMFIDSVEKYGDCCFDRFDFVIRLKYLPEIIFQSNKRDITENRKLENIFNTWNKMKTAKGTGEFFRDTDYYISNIIIYSLLYGRNFLNCMDIDSSLVVAKDKYNFGLKICDAEKILSEYALLANDFITINTDISENNKSNAGIWQLEKWSAFVSEIKKEFPKLKIIQIGQKNEIHVQGVEYNFSGKLNLKNTMIFLSNAVVHISRENDYIHLRNVLSEKKSVVLFGPEPHDFFALKSNMNIMANSKCPHWCMEYSDNWNERCLFEMEGNACFKAISIESVANATMQILKGGL